MNPGQRETLSYFQGAISTIVKKINSRVKQCAVINQFKPAGFCVSKLMLPKIFILFFYLIFFYRSLISLPFRLPQYQLHPQDNQFPTPWHPLPCSAGLPNIRRRLVFYTNTERDGISTLIKQ